MRLVDRADVRLEGLPLVGVGDERRRRHGRCGGGPGGPLGDVDGGRAAAAGEGGAEGMTDRWRTDGAWQEENRSEERRVGKECQP